METAYYSVFYQLLRFTFWVGTKDTQEWTALLNLSFLMFLNVFALYEAFAHYWYPYGHIVPALWFVGVFGLIIFFNYRILLLDGAYKNSATVQKQSYSPAVAWFVAGYVVISCLLAAYYAKQMHDVNVLFRH